MRYTSQVRLLGTPLIDVRVADGLTSRGIARGWIAIGDIALGRLLGVGGLATGVIAFGGLAIGIVPIGGLVFGVLGIGGGALGVWAVGGGAVALQGALGGAAIAREFALGGAAFAKHANDAAAIEYFSAMPFSLIQAAMTHARWLIFLALIPLLLSWRRRSQP